MGPGSKLAMTSSESVFICVCKDKLSRELGLKSTECKKKKLNHLSEEISFYFH